MQKINRVAILGAGTMGSQIAAHFANAAIPVLLLDLPSPGDRNAIAKRGIEQALRRHPPAFFTGDEAARIEAGNFEDDLSQIRACQWILEAVAENLDIKRALWARVDRYRDPEAILSTNTSGIPLADISRDFPNSFQQQFLGTHFFNPPRYLHLVEVIPAPHTLPTLVQQVTEFCELVLGKGIIRAKDTPNFIANRIGAFYSAAIQRTMVQNDYTIEEVDSLTGPLLGMPKTATFRLIDIIGLDIWAQVLTNVYTRTQDRWREWFALPPYMEKMLERGWLGEKSGQGFYKREGSNKLLYALDWKTLEYHPARDISWQSLERVRNKPLGERIRALLEEQDRSGLFIWTVLKSVFAYAAEMVPEISDRIVEIDRAMRWGFGHQLGPFELWDALGFEYVAKRMEPELPESIRRMLRSGASSFYRNQEYFDLPRTAWSALEPRPGVISLSSLKREQGLVDANSDASLIDLGDGVLCLEFHSKMNVIGEKTIQMMRRAVDRLHSHFSALVIGNQGPIFSAGANLALILSAAQAGDFALIQNFIRDFQYALLAIKYAPKPVIAAGFSRALGGGCEVILQSYRVQAQAELYMGLVERNVGLIPAGGGTKELAMRFADPMKGFDLIANAAVSSSAAEARKWGLLQPADRISMNPEFLLSDAKRFAIEMTAGYQSGEPRKEIVVSGEAGYRRMLDALAQKQQSGSITQHDFTILEKAAYVLSGGRAAQATVSEEDLLAMEREMFLSLCGMPQTQARISYMLEHGKPLRN
jgi:3-hydroxyacyl-CoA dehydrogenase